MQCGQHHPGLYTRNRYSMFSIDFIILFAGVLTLLGIVSSKFSARLGMPVLVLFLGLGMLAGSEGIGGIAFENYRLANSLGSIALALILFDGGLHTSLTSLRSAWRPALVLSTFGVLVTSLLTGLAAAWILNIPLLHGMLLGGIVGSTDAAAVFSVLLTSRMKLPKRLTATLEVESGSNDPMAIFLTVGLIGLITGKAETAADIGMIFVLQFGLGALSGIAVGYAAAWLVNRINLDYPGLYPILALAFGLLSYGAAAVFGGSGFLAVYVAGIVLGNSTIVFRRGIFLFHDAAAWLGQILLFVMLGLLSFPSRLASVALVGLLIALVLIFVARPLAVFLSALPFGFRPKEIIFLSWVGLKGAVPITLATFPLMAGVPGSELLFNVVFFVVLVSAVTQGWSLPTMARWLGLGQPSDPSPPISVEINALRHVDGDIVEYTVSAAARIAGVTLRDIALPDGAVVTLVVRNDTVIMPRGSTSLLIGDHVFIALKVRLKPLIDCLFDPFAVPPKLPPGFELSFAAQSSLAQMHRFFGMSGYVENDEGHTTDQRTLASGGQNRFGPFIISKNSDGDVVTLINAPEGVDQH
jgi:potassium/hydrogen antiporter